MRKCSFCGADLTDKSALRVLGHWDLLFCNSECRSAFEKKDGRLG